MGILSLIVGAGIIIVSSVVLLRTMATRRGGVRTQGTVIDNRESTYHSRTVYAPVIRFATQGGHTVEFVSDTYTERVHEIGEQVPVVYQPGKPEQAMLDTALGTWLIPTVLLAGGILFFLLGLLVLLGLLTLVTD